MRKNKIATSNVSFTIWIARSAHKQTATLRFYFPLLPHDPLTNPRSHRSWRQTKETKETTPFVISSKLISTAKSLTFCTRALFAQHGVICLTRVILLPDFHGSLHHTSTLSLYRFLKLSTHRLIFSDTHRLQFHDSRGFTSFRCSSSKYFVTLFVRSWLYSILNTLQRQRVSVYKHCKVTQQTPRPLTVEYFVLRHDYRW